MGKRRDWLSKTLKNIFTCKSQEKRKKKSRKPGKCWGKQRSTLSTSSGSANAVVVPASNRPTVEMSVVAEDENYRHDYPVALDTMAAPPSATAEVVHATSTACNFGIMDEGVAAVKIQTTFRGLLARRALSTEKAFSRLKSTIEGLHSKHQSATASKHMQVKVGLQFKIYAMRIRRLESNSALERQIKQKNEKKLDELRVSQTRRNSSNLYYQTFMDPNEPRWGWSWLEQRMAAQPWTNRGAIDEEVNNGNVSIKRSTSLSMSACCDTKLHSPKARMQSPALSTPTSGRLRHPSRRCLRNTKNDDLSSITSIQSYRRRRHSLAGSSMTDDLSLASCPASSPGYMASTVSSRAKSRPPSPLGKKPVKAAGGSARKSLSFSTTPAGFSGRPSPPSMDVILAKDAV